MKTLASYADVLRGSTRVLVGGAVTRYEPLRTSAWEVMQTFYVLKVLRCRILSIFSYGPCSLTFSARITLNTRYRLQNVFLPWKSLDKAPAWDFRASLVHVSPQSHTLFSPSLQDVCLTVPSPLTSLNLCEISKERTGTFSRINAGSLVNKTLKQLFIKQNQWSFGKTVGLSLLNSHHQGRKN